jgi:hypothetical protein
MGSELGMGLLSYWRKGLGKGLDLGWGWIIMGLGLNMGWGLKLMWEVTWAVPGLGKFRLRLVATILASITGPNLQKVMACR